ncbi:MAG: hypothetical protein LBT91_02660 [Bifidobacteriaceae bacterium]|jgi:antitoxin component HigA of HigAB toxin-antitoxin module|nr:hypothetical protein [Bifidobacteriaceae bacterium]
MQKKDFSEVYNEINPLLAKIGIDRARRGYKWKIEQIHTLFESKSATHKRVRSIILKYMPTSELQKHFKGEHTYENIIDLLTDCMDNWGRSDYNFKKVMEESGIKPARWSEIRRDKHLDNGYKLYLHELIPIFNSLYKYHKKNKRAWMSVRLQTYIFDYLFQWYNLLSL